MLGACGSRPTATSTRAGSRTRSSAAQGTGVTVETGVRVTDLVVDRRPRPRRRHRPRHRRGRNRRAGVRDVHAEVAALAGVNVPIVPMAHQYLITKPIDGVTDSSPAAPRPRQPRLLPHEVGGARVRRLRARPGAMVAVRRPADFNNQLLPEDWDRFAPLIRPGACRRVPAAEQRRRSSSSSTGPRGSRPTTSSCSARAMSTGCSSPPGSARTASRAPGGVGRVISEWILDGEPSSTRGRWTSAASARSTAVREFTRVARAVEVYSTYYDIHYPNEERVAGRPLRRSPAYARLAALGCAFGEKSGWERPNWFEPYARPGERRSLGPRGWAGEHWSPAIGAEALACRDSVVPLRRNELLEDRAERPRAVAFLDRICANEMDRPSAR